jgi:uncharacterized membrane protein
VDPHVHEWLHLVLRWAHVLAAIMWVGDSFLFMWLDRTLLPPSPPREGVAGELFLVHGGGYYQVEKRLFQPGRMPALLHWFRWESLSTWATGFLLLLLVYYAGGGALLVDPDVAKISVGTARAIGLASLPAAWLVYDALWGSVFGKTRVAPALSVALFAALAYGLTHALGSRAAYMHAGAALGTIMVLNVWMRILPVQRRALAAVRAGQNVDPAPGLSAKERSTHNSYLTLPVLFVMVSNHFPTTYGSRWNWAVLVLLALAGGAIRHFMLTRSTKTAWLLALGGALAAAAFVLTR